VATAIEKKPQNLRDDRKAAVWISALSGLLAGLCCFPPIVMVLLGLASVTVANDWGNRLYGDFKWHFRAIGVACILVALVVYYRRRGICTLDQAKRERTRILNTLLLVALVFLGVYITFNYIVLHYWGIAAGLPWAQWDESWAIPWAIGLAAAIAAVLFWQRSRLTPSSEAEAPPIAEKETI
jgi:hypothetical protein